MKIGILGGSFDPIHTGHAILANFASQSKLVNKVWLMVSRRNPLKSQTIADELDRLAMARIVAGNCENVEVSDFEMHLPEPSYTYDTLRALKEVYPDDEFKIIIGSDSLGNFPKWRNGDKIIKEFGVIVYPRPGYPLPDKELEGFEFLREVPVSDISSTLIRSKIKEGWDIEFLVPEGVKKYIIENQLYK